MVRCALGVCRLWCPDEYSQFSACNAHDTDYWLRLLCRFHVQYNICFAPSPEEFSIMIASEALWPDVVQYLTSKVHYLVVADSTLIESHDVDGDLFKTYRGNAEFLARPDACALDLAAALDAYIDKSTPTIVVWKLMDLQGDTNPVIPDDFWQNLQVLVDALCKFERVIVQVGAHAGMWNLPPSWNDRV